MSTAGAFLVLLPGLAGALGSGISSEPVPIAPPALTCAIYALAHEFALAIQPNMSDAQSSAVWDALRLDAACANTTKATKRARGGARASRAEEGFGGDAIFVAPDGDDANAGTEASPLRTLAAAQAAARVLPPGAARAIALLPGTHYLGATLALTAADSNLTIFAAKGERTATVSGATPLGALEWAPHNVTGGMNVYVADVPASVSVPTPFAGLRVAGERATRARWPNADPEYDLFPKGWHDSSADGRWLPPRAGFAPADDVVIASPNRSDEGPCASVDGYCFYTTGVGGACASHGFEPPAGYWCHSSPPRGAEYTVAFPSGLRPGAAAFDGRRWASWRPNETLVSAFRQGHWFTYAFLVDAYDAATRTLNWTRGGFQGGEGVPASAGGAEEWFVENVFDELDAPGEYYYDDAARRLFYFYNGTGAPPAELGFEAVGALEQLITLAGDDGGADGGAARDVALRGLVFTGASATQLAPHGLPSDGGGDWALARRAAVHLLGNVSRCTVARCLFSRVDGNALMVSGRARGVEIVGNEFHLVGESAIVQWGRTRDFNDGGGGGAPPRNLPAGVGPDARGGDHPVGTRVIANFVHEIGHNQKQVSCFFQAQSERTTLSRNLCFNGPRAGFNVNDGMAGGNLLERNLIFNMVRETADHGAFNSWDRQPFYVTDPTGPSGAGTFTPADNEITRNFWINDYNPQEATDNDDGSCYYHTHHNYFPLSANGLKSDFGGHDNRHHDNVYYVSTSCVGVCAQKPGHTDAFYNNTCLINSAAPEYASFNPGIGGDAWPEMHDNRVYTLDGNASESGGSIASWQAQGVDVGTTIARMPPDDAIIAMGRAVLQM